MSESDTLVRQVVQLVQRRRLSLANEKQTQSDIADVFTVAGIPFEREVRLCEADIVDFMVADTIAIEVKIKGQRKAIFRQLERYAGHDRVTHILLFTSVAMMLPGEIGGKPAHVASLSRGWL